MTNYLIIILILGLGAARLTALITRDQIFEPIRNLLWHWLPPENNHREEWFFQNFRKSTAEEREELKQAGVQMGWLESRWIDAGLGPIRKPNWLGSLLSCPFCVSVWVAVADYAAWAHWGHPVLVLNAVLSVAWVGAVATVKGGWV